MGAVEREALVAGALLDAQRDAREADPLHQREQGAHLVVGDLSVASDDENTPEGIVDSWGAGVTNARLGWQGEVGVMRLSPFLGVNNLWDRRYIGSVTLNGAFGRVLEPSPRRVVYIGTEVGYRTQ